MKIVVLDGYAENPGDLSWEGFKKMGEFTVYDRTPREDVEEILHRIGDAEIVCTNKTLIGREVIGRAPKLRYIGVLATGYNVVDVDAASEKGIVVTNIPAYGTAAVAQHTMALLLEICNQVGYHSQAVHEGRWQRSEDFCFWDHPLMELAGKTMGIIGYGRIGQATARLAEAFGMDVIACRRPGSTRNTAQTDAGKADQEANRGGMLHAGAADATVMVTLEELFARADVISLHCPLFPETENLICRETIGKMKDGVILLNTARGPLVNEADLAEALRSGKVYAAGLDVVSVEPMAEDNPLLGVKNCFITPHIAWASRESRQRLIDTAVENLRAFLAGEPVNVVNLPLAGQSGGENGQTAGTGC